MFEKFKRVIEQALRKRDTVDNQKIWLKYQNIRKYRNCISKKSKHALKNLNICKWADITGFE